MRKYVYRCSPAGQSLSSTTREEGRASLQCVIPKPHEESADASVIPISPWVRKQCEPPEVEEEVMGVDEQEEVVEEGSAPRTREFPGSLSPEELRVLSLTHIPYHPGCKCCVAGRKRDHQHPRRDNSHTRMHADLEAANGASICADYFFPRDKPGYNRDCSDGDL